MAPSGVSTAVEAMKRALPDVFVKRKLNFITIHYLYIGGMAFFWSAMVYAIGGMPYIDSLFFASGACTQSGLNTIDVNKIKTGQQVILYMLAMMCNPIAIHTSVVFVRLYWFEKRFKDVVREARQLRRTRSRSRQRRGSFLSEDTEAGRAEISVRGRAIQLLRNTGHRAEGRAVQQPTSDVQEKEKRMESSDTSQDSHNENSEKFSQRRHDSIDEVRLPQQMNAEQHIRFLENQRNPQDTTTLRIPSPREFDRGGRVQSLDEGSQELGRQTTRIHGDEASPEIMNAPRVAQHITFNEPDIPANQRSAARATTFPRIETGKASTLDPRTYDEDPMLRGRNRTRRGSGTGFLRTNTARTMEAAPYLSWQPTVARNSFFVNLTEEQREELGGIEYRALKTLALVLLGYFFLFHLLGILCLTPWIYTTHWGGVVTEAGQGRAWWGVFTAGSAFNDLGFTLTPDSMISFQSASFPMLLMTYLIIIGNTGFPCMLRFVIWALSKCVPVGSGLWEELQFLLDHPRRCFTLLFPRDATWWLFGILVVLNVLDLIFFIALDINDDTVQALSPWVRFLVGIFQAASTRTAGFAAVNLAELHPGIQVSYLIMMYISVFPIAISMRRTNVYEEKSLGIYASGGDDDDDDSNPSYVGAHLRRQLSFDLWYVFLGLFIICIVEGSRLENTNEYAFTIFSCLFEIISAYGTVGLSLGYPTANASFSSQFKVLSKLVIIAMQIRGRHRGLPYELDRAILLPSEGLHRKEAQEGEKMLQRRRSGLAQYDTQATASRQGPNGVLASTTSYDHAVDGHDDHGEELRTGPRQRRLTNKSIASSTGSQGEHPRSHPLHKGLGNAMFKVAGAENAIKEEPETMSSSSR
ncbi:low affinity potassium transporter [Knufia obscura]|uniref:Potassium transport protein n=2 Tax=Knufia TaxID=430999 RepID=A0AAN8F8T5_9EURO|nr:low affinity potassium transporter [Knufia obscura]KAK5953456.1 low affinity potassium transporter [Knufia fluminis]